MDSNKGSNIQLVNDMAIVASNVINEIVEKIRPVVTAFYQGLEKYLQENSEQIAQFFALVGETIVKAKEWQEERKISVSTMAENGWFPNWYTFFYRPSEDVSDLDELMINHIDESWEHLQKKIIELVPNRKHILETAFQLHEQNNYIASIPLLLAQSDGICSEEFSHFFSKDQNTGLKANDEILNKAMNNEIPIDFFSEILLEPFKVDLQLSNSSSKASKKAKLRGPNRHGIIHGSRKHLDYGSKVNGYKAFSFLAFIVYTVKDQFKET